MILTARHPRCPDMPPPTADARPCRPPRSTAWRCRRLYGDRCSGDAAGISYIPPDALEVFLEAFEGPLDLLLYLIRKQNFNILDIPLADVTRQYLAYVDQIRKHQPELASEYLLMAAMLIEIKSRMLLPPRRRPTAPELGIRAPNWCAA